MALNFRSPSPGGHASERRFVLNVGLIAGIVAMMFVVQLMDDAQAFRFANQAELFLQLLLLLVIVAASPQFVREMGRRKIAAVEAEEAKGRIELLFKMTDMLQSALGHEDANSVLRSTASALMPGFGGALYVFNNSGDRLDLSTSWHWPEAASLHDSISPSECWGLKRGKLQLNLVDEDALCCDHHSAELVTMEIPMMARGEIYGLLIVERGGPDGAEELRGMTSVATALADAMSLSLSNLALREKLRTQALRDALTGLYNRRYMEDALERSAGQAERNEAPVSLLMIDLDHFKKLNDEHGHAMGDAMLSEAAAAILGAIRPCDIACRYGGEELVVILPECGHEEALHKAEGLRSRIERLSDRHGVQVTASFGVSTFPETSNAKELLADADRALYRAKAEGRNRVAPALNGFGSLAVKPAARAA